jgi:hypothetical protein
MVRMWMLVKPSLMAFANKFGDSFSLKRASCSNKLHGRLHFDAISQFLEPCRAEKPEAGIFNDLKTLAVWYFS